MRQNNRPGPGFLHDAIAHCHGTGAFPIKRINIPQNNLVSELFVNPMFLADADRSIRRPHQRWSPSGSILDSIVSSAQLATHGSIRHFSKVRMRPTVISDFMTFKRGALHNLRVISHVLTDDEKCRFNVMSSQQLEQFRGQFHARPIIKGHGDVRPVDVHKIESDSRLV